MSKFNDISVLEYIRNNRKSSEDDIRERYGNEGVCVLDVFYARYSDARKFKDGRSNNVKREEVINQMIDDISTGKFKNPARIYKRHDLYWKILLTVGAIVATLCVLIFGGAVLLFVPPIWIIVFLLIWIVKKL